MSLDTTHVLAIEPSSRRITKESNQPVNSSGQLLRLFRKVDYKYIPRRCRWNPEKPPEFSWTLCFLFAFVSAFTVANIYYNHPILNVLAADFNVSFETASRIPTVMQAGYAGGILFICPLGDKLRRRPLALFLVFATATFWLGLCLTTSFNAFLVLSFLAALTTVTPQLMLPLVAELAAPKRRAVMISIVFGGLFSGILLARILSGLVTQYTGLWHTIYWISLGLQCLILILLFLFLPDYPSVNPDGVSYFEILWTIIRLPLRQPLLAQASLISFFGFAVFVGYWTTLTFILAGEPYNLSTLTIGLFALVGLPPFLLNPLVSHYITNLYHPIWACLASLLLLLAGVLIGTYIGTFSIAGLVIMGVFVDMSMIMSQTALRTQLVAVEPQARNRVNTVFIAAGFVGMLVGTSVANRLYAQGGWHLSGAAEIAFSAAAIIINLARGPYETGWIGWRGGWKTNRATQSPSEGHNNGSAATDRPGETDRVDATTTTGNELQKEKDEV